MDWLSKQQAVKRMIDKYGRSAQVVTTTIGTYNPATDSSSSTITTYDNIKILSVNPTMVNDKGVYSKIDSDRFLLNAIDLPDLTNIDFKIIDSNGTIFNPDKTIAIKPGDTTLLYIVDLK